MLLGIMTGADPLSMPVRPADMELPLQFRDLLSMSLNPEDLRLLLPSNGSPRLRSSRAFPEGENKVDKIVLHWI